MTPAAMAVVGGHAVFETETNGDSSDRENEVGSCPVIHKLYFGMTMNLFGTASHPHNE